MTHPNGAHAYADLLPTDAELHALDEVIQEVLGEELGELPGDDDDGPWHDAAGLANYAGDQLDLTFANEATRQMQDTLPPRRTSEERFSHALGRIAAGTYTTPAYFRQDLDFSGGPSHGCGTVDEFGRCSARFHAAGCLETVRGSAATGDHTAAERWNATLANAPSAADVHLAREDLMSIEELLDPGTGPTDTETLAYMRRQLGISGKTGLPPVPTRSPLAERLGIF